MPALAVADALRARGAEVRFVGARRAGAAGAVEAAGYPQDLLPLRGFARRLDPRNLIALAQAAIARPAGGLAARPPPSPRRHRARAGTSPGRWPWRRG